tara:strand:- start:280 stop:543 length:264 start_codon:yes stop_codon:yes gene_type:complete
MKTKQNNKALNDNRLTLQSNMILNIIENYEGVFNFTGAEIEEKWSVISTRVANNHIRILKECGYIKIVNSNEVGKSFRTITINKEYN